ncbi:MAG: SUF system Fe-S cluster assembly regulator [Planctomycetia bacterium]|nr:SUF system Fe-S cluster assembly regulator [Planctomycetia bacterium]
MFRITRLADYGILLMSYLATDRRGQVHTARDVSGATGVPLPTVSKILKALARAGLLASHRGVGGGFALAREGKSITVADVVTAIEGPIALTACLSPDRESCTVENSCPVRPNWERLNDAVRTALQSISVAEMVVPRFPTSSTSRPQGGGTGAMAPSPSSVGSPDPR